MNSHSEHNDHGEHDMQAHESDTAHDQSHDSHAGSVEAHGELGEHAAAMHEQSADQAVHDHTAHVDHSGHEQMFRSRFWVSLVLSIPVILYSEAVQGWFSFSVPVFPGSEWITPVFGVVIFLYGGVPFLKMAVPEMRVRSPGMMSLISLAISVAFLYSIAATIFSLGESLYWELVTLIVIMLLGHWLEMRSVRQASGALTELAKLMPDEAERLIPDGSTEMVPLQQLKVGDTILVRPGASVPADGEVVDGSSDLNEAMITGESKPVEKAVEDRVIAGTINGSGSLRVRVEATGDKTALAGIMRLVDEAQRSKSRTQILADRAASLLFYIAVVAAGVTAAAWLIAVGFDIEVIKRVTAVLVIACPHALGLAIPLVVAITTALGARGGILVRDRKAIENARNLNVVVFDKTGTLTKGEFGVVGVAVAEGEQEENVLTLAAAVEGDSEHLIARAIRNSVDERGLQLPKVEDFEAIKGRGIRGKVAGQLIHVGGPNLLEMLGLEPDSGLRNFAAESGEKARSVVYLVKDKRVSAAIALADVVRPESRRAVSRLHDMGIQVAMLTGDSEAVARAVAQELEVDRYFAEVLPEQKDQMIAQLQSEGNQVAMVGDGVNDAPALVRSDVGIAIGSGTDVAVESAGVILVKNNPLDVVKIIELSRASYRKMIQNLIWATGYNVVAIPLAAGVLAPWGILLSPAIGALFMSLSTIIVAINAQFLRRTPLTN
jgi:Cu2+-exporting ATPase